MSLPDLESALGHTFADRSILNLALTHRSYASEHADADNNERLEFVGDAVLQLVVTEYIYTTRPDLREGEMAKLRASCVNRTELAVIARLIGLGSRIRLGVGERHSEGADKDSILADAMEAVLAAVYVDGGIEAARTVVLRHWRELIDTKAEAPGNLDYKTRLQELLATRGERPEYLMFMDGPDHQRAFTATVRLDEVELGFGTGASKKEAQQAAARQALDRLDVRVGRMTRQSFPKSARR